MEEKNYLEVGKEAFCLHCSKNIPRDEVIEHWETEHKTSVAHAPSPTVHESWEERFDIYGRFSILVAKLFNEKATPESGSRALHEEAEAINKAISSLLKEQREQIAKEVEAEKLSGETGHPEDIAYNQALEDILTILKKQQ